MKKIFKIFVLLALTSLFLQLHAMPLIVKPLSRDNYTRLNVYDLDLDIRFNARSNLLETYLWRNQVDMHATTIPVELGLSPFVKTYKNTYAVAFNANCFNSVFSSIVTTYWAERFMSTDEFLCQLNSYADPVENWSFGDIAVLSQNGTPVHAMTYLGWDRDDSNKHYVFSKFGFDIAAKYLITSLRETMMLYKTSDIKFYRLRNLELYDPKTTPHRSNCTESYQRTSATFNQDSTYY